ncbi:hypothetical protein [Rhizobium sp. 22-785-1]
MSDLEQELAKYISRSKELSSASLVWNHKDLYRVGAGVKEVKIAFSRKTRDVSEAELCLFRLARHHLSDVLPDQKQEDISKAICVFGKPKIEFEEEDEEGYISEADVDQRTMDVLTAKAKEIYFGLNEQQKISVRTSFARELLALCQQKFGYSVATALKVRWLDNL